MLSQAELRVDWVSHYLFESPWLIIVGLAVVWLVLRVVARMKQNKTLQRASWAPLVLIVALWAAATLVTTRGEKLVQTVEALLLSVEDKDFDTFRTIVPEDAVAYFPPGRNPERYTRERVERRLTDANVRDLLLLGIEAGLVGEDAAVTVIDIRAQGEYSGIVGLQRYTWVITWRYTDGRWEAYEFECTDVGFPIGKGNDKD